MNNEVSNSSIRPVIQPEIQHLEKPQISSENSTVAKMPENGTVIPKPLSSMGEVKNFLKESLKISGGLLLLGAGSAATVALLPVVVGGAAAGLALGTMAALLSGKDIHKSISAGALTGVALGSIAGPGVALIGIHLLNTSKSEAGGNISKSLPKEIPSQIRQQLEAFNKTNNTAKTMSEWVQLAKTDPNGFAEELYKNDKLQATDKAKISDEDFGKLLSDLSKKLDVSEFGKIASGAFRAEIKDSQHAGNLMRLTASTVEGKVFKQFRLAYLEPSLEKSESWKSLASDIYKADPLVTIDQEGNREIRKSTENSKDGVSEANKLVEQSLRVTSGILNDDSKEMNVFKDILKTLKHDVDQKFPGAEDGKMDAGTKAVSSLIFLRCINAGLINKKIELEASDKADGISPNKDAPFTTLTKVMQNMANGVNFGEKEGYMTGFNATIEDQKAIMNDLIKSVI